MRENGNARLARNPEWDHNRGQWIPICKLTGNRPNRKQMFYGIEDGSRKRDFKRDGVPRTREFTDMRPRGTLSASAAHNQQNANCPGKQDAPHAVPTVKRQSTRNFVTSFVKNRTTKERSFGGKVGLS